VKKLVTSTLSALVAATLLVLPTPVAQAAPSDTVDSEVSQAITGVAVKAKLIAKLGADALHIHVDMQGSKAVLTGQVEKKESQELAKEVALSVSDVKEVDNRLTQNPAREASAAKNVELEIKDAVLETKVKNALLTQVGKNALKIEVEATNGVVSLRGTVPSGEISSVAVAKAKSVSGVTKVVNLLKTAA
jgi:osmotically-inducible protein OsmY